MFALTMALLVASPQPQAFQAVAIHSQGRVILVAVVQDKMTTYYWCEAKDKADPWLEKIRIAQFLKGEDHRAGWPIVITAGRIMGRDRNGIYLRGCTFEDAGKDRKGL